MQLDERLDNRNEIELEWLFAHRASRDQNVKRIRAAQEPVDLLLKRRGRIRGGGHHTVRAGRQVAVAAAQRSPTPLSRGWPIGPRKVARPTSSAPAATRATAMSAVRMPARAIRTVSELTRPRISPIPAGSPPHAR